MSVDSVHRETLAVHAGWRADPDTGAVAVPIYQTTSYQFHNARQAESPLTLEEGCRAAAGSLAKGV